MRICTWINIMTMWLVFGVAKYFFFSSLSRFISTIFNACIKSTLTYPRRVCQTRLSELNFMKNVYSALNTPQSAWTFIQNIFFMVIYSFIICVGGLWKRRNMQLFSILVYINILFIFAYREQGIPVTSPTYNIMDGDGKCCGFFSRRKH